ncbi:CACTA en-spm transposon protein [Cucumis melo var. makuwa]|uniref:CACTA en-spm transposon protein n=1 Tax=Cucumis melo var. makuwa TaxID=1194695 RepID=A0A5D3CSR2_CUCMM|nr:CACTA en-spm transposon protein [Cucumis melo var. makuwa]TYK14943.1 CACTA en-spm transposon protein [Cucumis melo var. makuwa]
MISSHFRLDVHLRFAPTVDALLVRTSHARDPDTTCLLSQEPKKLYLLKSIMSSIPNSFQKIDDLFLEFDDDLNNAGLSSVGDTLDDPQPTHTPRRRQHSRNMELERYVQKNEKIPISIV